MHFLLTAAPIWNTKSFLAFTFKHSSSSFIEGNDKNNKQLQTYNIPTLKGVGRTILTLADPSPVTLFLLLLIHKK